MIAMALWKIPFGRTSGLSLSFELVPGASIFQDYYKTSLPLLGAPHMAWRAINLAPTSAAELHPDGQLKDRWAAGAETTMREAKLIATVQARSDVF